MSAPALAVEGLTVTLGRGADRRVLVDGLSLNLGAGQIHGLVGESGSGKTVACRALLRLLPGAVMSVAARSVRLAGREIANLPERDFAALRGRAMGMVFQNPASHLNPLMSIGAQIAETARRTRGLTRAEARAEAVDLLRQVGIPDPVARAGAYPHELSGGMRQRAMIALALAPEPQVLIADEPTTALDVTVQAQVLRLLMTLRDRRGLSIVLITHDLAVVAQTCDAVSVLYAGRLAETGPTRAILRAPRHCYTAGLIACHPAPEPGQAAAAHGPLRTIEGQPPAPAAMPAGCRFHPRCPRALPQCRSAPPALVAVAADHRAACLNPPTGVAPCP